MRWTDRRRVERMLQAGSSCAAVARAVGLHQSAVYRIRRQLELPRRWYLVTDQERRQIVRLLNEDLSRREVARRTNRGLGTVSRIGTAACGTAQRVARTRQAYRCPGCGYLICVRPCLICLDGGAEDRIANARRSA